jgi:hypothetical protein
MVQSGVLWFLLAAWTGLLDSPVGMSEGGGGVVALVSIPLAAAGIGSFLFDQHLRRWYERTYGKVDPDPAVRRTEYASTAILIAAVAAIIIAGRALGLADWVIFAGGAMAGLARTAASWRRSGGVHPFEVAVAVDWGVLALLAAAGLWSDTYATSIICATAGVTFVVAGVLEHLLLTRTLAGPGLVDVGEEP